MRAKDIVGKKVAGVVQERTYVDKETLVYDVKSIVFEDGTVLYFSVAELPGDYAVEGAVIKGERGSMAGVSLLVATKCRNCGERPTVRRSHNDPEYDYVLRHAVPTTCPFTYHLLTYQHTPDKCVREWNSFNTKQPR